MRPILLQLQAFGPFAGAEQVDFEALSRDGLFLIAGDTGAGKTSILDAMCFALFGMSSGHHRDSLEAMRCRQSPWGTDTYVKFTLECGGAVYRFERTLACKRLKLSPGQSVLRRSDAGVFEPLFENCRAADANDKARELIGLDYEQFRQVVILPQGQFERFLTSRVEEKEKILSTLFGIHRWSGIADSFYRIARERRDASDALKNEMEILLRAEGCEDREALCAKLAACQSDLEETERRHAEADLSGRQAALEAGRELLRGFERLHALERSRETLLAQQAEMRQSQARLAEAEQAETLRAPLEALARAEAEQKSRGEQARLAEAAHTRAAEAMERAAEALEQTEQQEAQMREKEALLLRCRDKKAAYAGLRELAAAQRRCAARLAEADAARERLRLDSEKKRETGRLAYVALEQAEAACADGRRRYMEDIYGQIAAELQPGAPCPVCGSTAHPLPAARSADAPDREALRALEESAKAKRSAWSAADRAREAAEAALVRQTEALHAAEGAANAAGQALETALDARLPGIPDAAALEARIRTLETELADNREAIRRTRAQAENARSALAAAEAQHRGAAKEAAAADLRASQAEEALNAALGQSGFDSAARAAASMLSQSGRDALRDTLRRYETRREENARQLSEAAEALQGCAEPDRDALAREREALEQEQTRYQQARTTLLNAEAHLTERLSRIDELYKRYHEDRGQLESDLAFARSLRGDTGIGLQRYVLGVRFSSVIAEANRMLEKVHGGRYRLYRSDARGEGNKRGLELYIRDARAPEDAGRSVATLSGGEKFLVSLALSIGLSASAGRGGIRLGALFIDEGFGSLDERSIDDALEVLSGIQRGGGMVGVISHVALLRDSLASKLEVRKTREGSHIVQSIG